MDERLGEMVNEPTETKWPSPSRLSTVRLSTSKRKVSGLNETRSMAVVRFRFFSHSSRMMDLTMGGSMKNPIMTYARKLEVSQKAIRRSRGVPKGILSKNDNMINPLA